MKKNCGIDRCELYRIDPVERFGSISRGIAIAQDPLSQSLFVPLILIQSLDPEKSEIVFAPVSAGCSAGRSSIRLYDEAVIDG